MLLRNIAFLLFGMLILGLGVAWWADRPERALATAARAIESDDLETAYANLSVSDSSTRTRSRSHFLRTRLAVERRDLAEAVRLLDQVSADSDHGFDYAYWKGRTLYAAGQPLLAQEWFAKARELKRNDIESLRWYAAAAYDLGDRAATVEALRHASNLAPDDPKIWRTLGIIYKENVEYLEARNAFEKSLKAMRFQPNVQLELAETMLNLGEIEATEKLLHACKGRVSEGRRLEALADVYETRGRVEDLREIVKAGLATTPDSPRLLAHEARLLIADGNNGQALLRLNRALAIDSYRAESYYQRGHLLMRMGQVELAQIDLERSASIKRSVEEMSRLNGEAASKLGDPDVRAKLGDLCAELGKSELSASWYRAALACDPNHQAAKIGLDRLGINPGTQVRPLSPR